MASHLLHPQQFVNLPPTQIYPLLGPRPVVLINACFILDTIGQVALTILIATLVFSDRVRKRNASLISLLVVTVLCSIPPALLFYTELIMNPRPPFGLCFSQAIFKDGTDPMFVVASFALIIEFLQGAGITVMQFIHTLRTPLLVAMPYLTFVVFATITAGLGGTHPNKVLHETNRLYCWVDFPVYNHGVEIFSVVVVVLTVSLEVAAIIKLRQNWSQLRTQVGNSSNTSLFSLSQAFRICGFTILQLNYVILCGIDFYFTSTATHILPILYEALMPLATFLIFGTTEDCLQVWMFWRPRLESTDATPPLDPITFASPSKSDLSVEVFDGSQPVPGRTSVINIRPTRTSRSSTLRVSLPSSPRPRASLPPPPLPPKEYRRKSRLAVDQPDDKTFLTSPRLGEVHSSSPSQERLSQHQPPTSYKRMAMINFGLDRHSTSRPTTLTNKRVAVSGDNQYLSPTSPKENDPCITQEAPAPASPSPLSPPVAAAGLPDKTHYHLTLSLPPSGFSLGEF